MGDKYSLQDEPKELVQLLEFLTRQRHSLYLNTLEEFMEKAIIQGIPPDILKSMLYDVYKKIFDEFLESIKNA